MKRILITGAGSYIGTSVEKWLSQPEFSGMYQVETVDMMGDSWKNHDFSGYDSVFHVAGIAHADIGRVTEEQKKRYYQINCDLAFNTAVKAKKAGVSHFIYMSSIIVYGESASVGKKKIIKRETKPSPSNFYGDSKWRAEQKLEMLSDETFRIAFIRPPMIYGEGSKGNYVILEKIALRTPIFPDFPNERSMCEIGHLCEFVRKTMELSRDGVCFPQDPEYVKTADMVKKIAGAHGKRLNLVKGLNWAVYLLGMFPGKTGRLVNKAFGSLVYEKDIDIGFSGLDDKPV